MDSAYSTEDALVLKFQRFVDVLPKNKRPVWSPRQFISELPQVVLEAVTLRASPTARAILEKRLLANVDDRGTFDEISLKLGTSKQSVEQVFKTTIRRLHRNMIDHDYRGWRVVIRPEFASPLNVLSNSLGFPQMMTLQEWHVLIERTWRVKAAEVRGIEALLLAILGFERWNFVNPRLKPVIARITDKRKARFERAATIVTRILTTFPSGLKFSQITERLHRKSRLREVNAETVRQLLQSIDGVKCRGDVYYLRRPQEPRADK